MTRPTVAVGAVVVDGDRLLMVRRGHGPAGGTWSIPGGHIELGETAAEAVVRELSEETGLAGVCGSFLDWSELIADDSHVVILDFEVSVLDDTDPVAGDDASEVEWVPLSDVCDRRLPPGLAEFLHGCGLIATIAVD